MEITPTFFFLPEMKTEKVVSTIYTERLFLGHVLQAT